jgi:hypothetical protein
MKTIGKHQRTEVAGKDLNDYWMVYCLDCETYAHAADVSSAETDLAATACAPNCNNCKNLRHSHAEKPAVPIRGSCIDILHVCPNDGNRWWQFNTYFHPWKQVTDTKEWESLNRNNSRERY